MSHIHKDGPYSWLWLTVTAIVCFTFIGLADSMGIIVAVFIERLHGSNAIGGWIGSVIFFLALALTPLVVYIHRRAGFRWCMLITSILFSFSLCLTPFMTNTILIFFTYSIPFGCVLSVISTLTIITQREYFSKYFGLAVGVRFSANAIGAMVVSIILPIILAEFGYKMTFFSMLVFTPVLLLYGLVARHQAQQVQVRETEKCGESVTSLYKEFFQDKSFTVSLIGVTMFTFTCLIPLIFMVRYGVTLGYPLSKAKWLMVTRGITTFVARLLAGRLGDIFLKNGKVKMVSQITFVVFGVLNFMCSFLRSFPLLLVYMGLVGIVEGVWWVTYPILIMEITGGYYYNEAYSLVCLIIAFAILLGPPIVGRIFDVTNDFRYVFYLAFGVSLLAAITLNISSRVRVESEQSLVQKGKLAKENMPCETDRSLDKSHSILESGVKTKLVYETAV
ncbi:monocarboxylate transporter 4-like [Dendronephthya gigantea]|uniref:monocarboxylate transporter 4-like n=1 Tax=Dendronephthya gigantea TaxID=151771 RepID=UPI00106C3D55|nr:monocarboxylate transporter 4-like [Dendronephthya gigantea]